MKSKFESFIDNIPKNIHNNTKSFEGNNIAVFFPTTFVTNRKLSSIDYHFVIFHSTPPLVTFKKKEVQFKRGCLICIEPGTELTVHPNCSIAPVKYISICVNKDFFLKVSKEIDGRQEVKFNQVDVFFSNRLLNIIELLIDEINKFELTVPLMIESIETQIAIQLLRDSNIDLVLEKKGKDLDNTYIDSAIKYINEYYSSNITVKEMCDSIYVSVGHFQRIFKKQFDQTPHQYLISTRIRKAKQMLEKEKMNVEDISRYCGFVNAGHFSTVFKKSEGISPSEYRRSVNEITTI